MRTRLQSVLEAPDTALASSWFRHRAIRIAAVVTAMVMALLLWHAGEVNVSTAGLRCSLFSLLYRRRISPWRSSIARLWQSPDRDHCRGWHH